jgi:hypothetical protein
LLIWIYRVARNQDQIDLDHVLMLSDVNMQKTTIENFLIFPWWGLIMCTERNIPLRSALARNRKLNELPDSSDLCLLLANYTNLNVRYNLASNPSIAALSQSGTIALILASDSKSYKVRQALASNDCLSSLPNASEVALNLASDSDKDVRYALAENIGLSSLPNVIKFLLRLPRTI